MPNPHISTQDWYYHAPSKKTVQTPKVAPPASQIPGIGGLPDEHAHPEGDDRHFRRKWIRDTDSKYIKLAKGGGRKNLLAFRSPPVQAEEPVPYPRVDWFDHEHPEEELDESCYEVEHEEEHTEQKQGYHVLPEWYVHVHDVPDDDHYVTGSYRSNRPIMGFDNMSKWQRDAKDAKENPNNVRLPPLKKTHKPKADKRYEELKEAQKNDAQAQRRQVRLPKIFSFDREKETNFRVLRDNQPVNFKHLLSMGYQRDWFEEQGQKAKDERTERKKQQKDMEEKREIQNRNVARKPMNASDSDKPMFKLSRFEKVQPRVESFRT